MEGSRPRARTRVRAGRVLGPFALLLALAACTAAPAGDDGVAVPSVSSAIDRLGAAEVVITGPSGEVVLPVRVARTDDEQQQGLMGVPEVPDGFGLLFPFGREAAHGGFWMLDTLVPLDLAFVGADGTVLAIASMVPCPGEPCPITDPGVPYAAALEVRAGWFAERGVRVGDRLTWRERPGDGGGV